MEVDVGTPIAMDEVDEAAGTVSADAEMELKVTKDRSETAVSSEIKCIFLIRLTLTIQDSEFATKCEPRILCFFYEAIDVSVCLFDNCEAQFKVGQDVGN